MGYSLTNESAAFSLPLNSINTRGTLLKHGATRYPMPRELREQAQCLQSLLGVSGGVVTVGIDFTLRDAKPFISQISVAHVAEDDPKHEASVKAYASLKSLLEKRADTLHLVPYGGYDSVRDAAEGNAWVFNGEALDVILHSLPAASRGAARG